MSREVHGGRALLNLPGFHSTAAVVAEIDDTKDKVFNADDDGYKLAAETMCRITDCDNAVNVEFDIHTANQLENSLHKLDAIVDTLLSMRDGLIIEHHRLQDRLDDFPNAERLYNLRNAVGKRSSIAPPSVNGHRWEGSE